MPDLMDEAARTWIAERSLLLAKSINKTTLEAIMAELEAGRAANETITQLSKRIEGYFTGNAKARAAMIARTETIAANNEGTIRRLEMMGINKSEFYASPDACSECTPYVGIYQTSETHGMVPVHPNCKCQIMGVIGEQSTQVSEPVGEEWYNNLNDKEKGHLQAWQEGNEYRNIRHAEMGEGSKGEIARAREFNAALDKAGNYKGVTYRGLKLDDDRFKQLGGILNEDSDDFGKILAKEIKLKASASASPIESVAMDFTHRGGGDHRVLLRINGKTGVDLSSIKTDYAFEREIVLRKGTTYTITGSNYSNRLTIVDLVER